MAGRSVSRPTPPEEAVARYKAILREVLDTRPSGTRKRLAAALGKNQSFVSQIASPTYSVPIPARHLEAIFEICHFSAETRTAFLEAYGVAHPGRLSQVAGRPRLRPYTVHLPDLGSVERNERLNELVADFVRNLIELSEDKA